MVAANNYSGLAIDDIVFDENGLADFKGCNEGMHLHERCPLLLNREFVEEYENIANVAEFLNKHITLLPIFVEGAKTLSDYLKKLNRKEDSALRTYLAVGEIVGW